MQWSWLRGWHVLAVFVVAMAFNAWFFTIGPYADMAQRGGISDEALFSSPGQLRQFIENMDAETVGAYQAFLAWDLVYPLLQGLWLAGFLQLGTRRWPQLPKWAPLVAVGSIVADWLENATFYAMSEGATGAAVVAMLLMHVKLLCVVAAILASVALVGWYIANPVKRSRRAKGQGKTTAAGRRL